MTLIDIRRINVTNLDLNLSFVNFLTNVANIPGGKATTGKSRVGNIVLGVCGKPEKIQLKFRFFQILGVCGERLFSKGLPQTHI